MKEIQQYYDFDSYFNAPTSWVNSILILPIILLFCCDATKKRTVFYLIVSILVTDFVIFSPFTMLETTFITWAAYFFFMAELVLNSFFSFWKLLCAVPLLLMTAFIIIAGSFMATVTVGMFHVTGEKISRSLIFIFHNNLFISYLNEWADSYKSPQAAIIVTDYLGAIEIDLIINKSQQSSLWRYPSLWFDFIRMFPKYYIRSWIRCIFCYKLHQLFELGELPVSCASQITFNSGSYLKG